MRGEAGSVSGKCRERGGGPRERWRAAVERPGDVGIARGDARDMSGKCRDWRGATRAVERPSGAGWGDSVGGVECSERYRDLLDENVFRRFPFLVMFYENVPVNEVLEIP